jgi:hypothetical protein
MKLIIHEIEEMVVLDVGSVCICIAWDHATKPTLFRYWFIDKSEL